MDFNTDKEIKIETRTLHHKLRCMNINKTVQPYNNHTIFPNRVTQLKFNMTRYDYMSIPASVGDGNIVQEWLD